MKSIKELYRIGTGPSSSHTMGPRWAAEQFAEKHPDADKYIVTLYGSLAATGKGHMTDIALEDAPGKAEKRWKSDGNRTISCRSTPTVCAFRQYFPTDMRPSHGPSSALAEEPWWRKARLPRRLLKYTRCRP